MLQGGNLASSSWLRKCKMFFFAGQHLLSLRALLIVCDGGESERGSCSVNIVGRERTLDEIASGRFPSEPDLPTGRAPQSYGGLAMGVCSRADSGCAKEVEHFVHGFGERVATFGEFGRRLLLLHERFALRENHV